ncbi:MAG: hypothetical protein HZA51_17655 [Planctomycetes bacterium]|nr:hypothetical protein [Planctomycetota bacterium]
MEAIQRQILPVVAELRRAKDCGQPTEQLEATLRELEARRTELKGPDKIDTQKLPWPELRSKLAEIRRISRSDEQVSLADARTLIDMFYVDVDPTLNLNLQHATLTGIKGCTDGNLLAEDVRQFLRDGIIEYFRAAQTQTDGIKSGPLCTPFSVVFLSGAIAAVSEPGDSEAIECIRQLHKHLESLGKLLELKPNEAAGYAQMVKEAEELIALADGDGTTVPDLGAQGLSDEDIRKALQLYRKILRAPSRRVKPSVVTTIDTNILRIGQMELSKANWTLWRDAAIALGPKRASKALTDFVAANAESSEKAKGAVLKRVNQVYSRRAE